MLNMPERVMEATTMVSFLGIMLALAAPLSAVELERITASDIAAAQPAAPRADKAGKYADGMLDPFQLMALTGPKLLYTQVADTPAKFEQFKAVWQPIIRKAGLKALTPEYSPGFAALKYETTNGLAIRSFMCDTAHMPLPEAEMENTLNAALNGAGLNVLGSFGIPVDPDTFTKPTVNVYYATRFNENQDRERQLRYLGFRSDAVKLDMDLLSKAGIKVAAKYGPSIFYIGPRVGVTLAVANDEGTVAKQKAYYTDLVRKRGETLLGIKTDQLPSPVSSEGTDYTYLTKVYYLR
jgi:hypothetical protein